MSKQINIILAKASWCPHCVHFTPIYELAKEKIKQKSELSGYNIDFDSFELDNEKQLGEFKSKYPGLIDFLSGYPTVYFQMSTGDGKPKKTEFIEHSVANGTDKKLLEQAAETFIQNIINKQKTILSGNTVTHMSVQKGGMSKYTTSMDDVRYRNKYLKYKMKYLNLRK